MSKKTRISQSDVPSYSLEKALRIPVAIADNYACDPVTPIQLAKALGMTPTSGPFRSLCGASIAYGLTSGGYNASDISLTPLGRRTVKPMEEREDFFAKREAFLKPRVINEFMGKYSGSSIPKEEIACNVLNDMGVPQSRTKDVLELIKEGAQSLSMITEIKGKQYIEIGGSEMPIIQDETTEEELDDVSTLLEPQMPKAANDPILNKAGSVDDEKKRKVFITHGKNKGFVDPIKQLLKFGEMEAVVSVENQSVSKPVPDKVMDDMRTCGAAIIHVDAETRLLDQQGKEQIKLNDNVLIEIGAAMALYGRRFILLVKEGVTLPSNLQGLYEVRYKGDALDGDATINLLQAINAMKDEKVQVAA